MYTRILNYLKTRNLVFLSSLKSINAEILQFHAADLVYKRMKSKYSFAIKDKSKYSKKGEKVSSKKIFVCWLQGIDKAPAIVKKCVASLAENMKDREIIIITRNNMGGYVDFPDFILDKWERGILDNTHFSELLRLQLLIKHGGTWVDSTVFCSSDNIPQVMLDAELFVFKALAHPVYVASSWFISAQKENSILMMTRDLLFEYWKRENKLIHYFIFHIMFAIATENASREWKNVPTYSNISPHILQWELLTEYSEQRFNEIKNISPFHKLTYKLNSDKYDDPNCFYQKLIESNTI